MAGNTVTVQRADDILSIPEAALHAGDVLLLQAGDLVPADLKLVEATGLEIDEWELTGEIVPAAKTVVNDDVFIYQGSRVTRGRGKGIVVAVGQETEFAEILKQPWERTGLQAPPLVRGQYFLLLVLLLPPLIVALRQTSQPVLTGAGAALTVVLLLLLQNGPLFKHVAIAVASRMLARRNIRIHDRTALDALGDLDIVCLDKTGVLTTRDIAVRHVHCADETPDMAWFASASEVAALTATGCALCNDVVFLARLNQANPIDRALMSFALQHGYAIDELTRQYRRVYEEPFDSEARYMAAGFEQGDQRLYFIKGDPEVILKKCRNYLTTAGSEQSVDFRCRRFIRTTIDAITREGNIVIALAFSRNNMVTPPGYSTFLGLIELENPLRPGVPEVIEQLKQAGIRTIMLTGDRPETATAVSRQAGITAHPEFLLTGKHIERMGFSDVAWQTAYVSIFARLLPSQKGILVRLFQQSNHRVAMVGDGPNDTIALRAADVGISFMENSSPIARRVAKVLVNDVADLVPLLRNARRVKSAVRWLAVVRVIAAAGLLAGWYVGMLR